MVSYNETIVEAASDRGDYWESIEEIPEPHVFKVRGRLIDCEHEVQFEERHDHHDPASAALRDNSIRSAYIHVIADAVVSVLAITGLVLARLFGWLWMDRAGGHLWRARGRWR
jgi:Co/Zn/Cd efflux system component